jgi:hypothetical protein
LPPSDRPPDVGQGFIRAGDVLFGGCALCVETCFTLFFFCLLSFLCVLCGEYLFFSLLELIREIRVFQWFNFFFFATVAALREPSFSLQNTPSLL